ncbi:hypothetical protein [Catellatospora sp. NPDC049133]|jgi:hypothetical protein|uniref:hypothetical protein n=1 Tax=Catellatospora sp. NPDC049133 TaxID=3155499 RepID=UPI0033D8FF77
MDHLELARRLRVTPRMFLPDDRFATLVAFLEGGNQLTNGDLLRGFNEWVQERLHGPGYLSSLHWSAEIAESVAGRARKGLSMPEELEEQAKDVLLDMLDGFLSAEPRAATLD